MTRLRWWDIVGLLILWCFAEGAAGAMFGKYGYFVPSGNPVFGTLLGFLCILPLAVLYRCMLLFAEFATVQENLVKRGELEEKKAFGGGLTDTEERELEHVCDWWRSK